MNNTSNQFLKVDNYDIDNEVQNIPVINHGQKANSADKRDHQQTRHRATECTRNDSKM